MTKPLKVEGNLVQAIDENGNQVALLEGGNVETFDSEELTEVWEVILDVYGRPISFPTHYQEVKHPIGFRLR